MRTLRLWKAIQGFVLAVPALAGGIAAALLAGCSDGLGLGPPEKYEKPTVAVLKFGGLSAGRGRSVGAGTAEALVERLLATGRFDVVERADLGEIAGELVLQQSGATRREARAEKGRLKNVQYLIKGSVTDFSLVAGVRGGFSVGDWHVAGGGNRAVFGVSIQVVEVESGQVLSSRTIQESLHATEAEVKGSVKNVSFGSSAFYRTSLGEATQRVMKRAVREIAQAIASRPWTPRIAQIGAGGPPDGGTTNGAGQPPTAGPILISGGQDRRIITGSEYDVLEAGPPIRAPDTGDVIGAGPDAVVGRLRVTKVQAGYSECELVAGDAKGLRVGQRCRRAE